MQMHLLSAITGALFPEGIQIIGSQVTTGGLRVHDRFYVTEADGSRLADPASTPGPSPSARSGSRCSDSLLPRRSIPEVEEAPASGEDPSLLR